MRHCAIALSGTQINSSIVQGELCSPKVAPERCTDRRNLRSLNRLSWLQQKLMYGLASPRDRSSKYSL